MYDFLNKIGLKAVLEAIKGKMPTSLPANGGNADTVDGMHANDFIYPRAMLSKIDLNTILYPCSALIMADCTNIPTPNSWGTLLCYSGGTGSHVQLWVTATDSSMFKRHYDGARWSDWKEISTTPIKSTGWITSPTDQYGAIILPNSDTRRYLSITAVGCYAEMFLFDDEYTVHITNGNYEKIINTPISYNAFYIE